MTDQEQWRPIQGFEGSYEVSDMGRVRSLSRRARTAFGTRLVPGRFMRPTIKKHGYAEIALSRGCEYAYKLVHRLVLETFVGEQPTDHEGGHFNGIRTDNRLDNLRWVTRMENMQDQYRHGTRITGEKVGTSILTDEIVHWIRESPQTGAAIAHAIGVSVSTVCRAREGRTWAMQLVSGRAHAPCATP